MAEMIDIEVAYATPEKQSLKAVQVPVGTSAIDAIERSGIRDEFPGMVVDESALGVFSRKIDADYEVQAGDRVEIYRPLIADPKEMRRLRAKQKN